MIRVIRFSLGGVGIRAIVIEKSRIRHALGYNGEGTHVHRQPFLGGTACIVWLHIPGASPNDQRPGREVVGKLMVLSHTIEIPMRHSHDDLRIRPGHHLRRKVAEQHFRARDVLAQRDIVSSFVGPLIEAQIGMLGCFQE